MYYSFRNRIRGVFLFFIFFLKQEQLDVVVFRKQCSVVSPPVFCRFYSQMWAAGLV